MQETNNGSLLAKRLGVDIFAASAAAFGVSPFIAIVDRSIIENASGKEKLGRALKQGFVNLFTRPFTFIRSPSFYLVFGVYATTYSTANTIDTVCAYTKQDNQTPKFLGTTIANMTTCIYKDRAFTRMFGLIAPKGLPWSSYGYFAARDALTIAASFNIPPTLAKEFQDRKIILDNETSQNVAQLICPAAVQFISCALHLLGLDIYNRPGESMSSRFQFLQRTYLKTTITRIARIGPAFGIGGVGNRVIRERVNEMVDQTNLTINAAKIPTTNPATSSNTS
ncbi:5667_t:CDS:2 [Diversispora eburnea]|uniref:5667_t:CDS:1 n=1 Tax=Diversispora eburnea TaxID=1213867 RepID=A0A9N8UXT4_9GLOM|nr:5667_t:CDS:2 [Diversispora eburnea]